ncbi:hypothetical protein FHG87_002991 [Trinorchestia longiramus]|nr:hypothetical protein FHG87_002991 [Trinorchestia longiramus]
MKTEQSYHIFSIINMQFKTRCRIVFQFCFITLLPYCQPSNFQQSCKVLTRLPTSNLRFKDKESCTLLCEVWTSLGSCQVDPTCFFKTTLSLVEPATYHHLLDLTNLRNPSDIEERMKLVTVLARNAMKEIDDMSEKIEQIHSDFKNSENVTPGSLFEQPHQDLKVSSKNNLTCDAKCEFPEKEKCKLSVFCYLNEEITELQRRNFPLSYLLNLSNLNSVVHKYDDESVKEELFSKLRMQKIELYTFLSYAFETYNIMVDINNRNIEYITKKLKNSEFSAIRDADTECPSVYRQLIHRPPKLECQETYLSFLQITPLTGDFGSGDLGFSGFGGGFINPGPNCPGECMERNDSGDCVINQKCARKES